MMTLVLQSAPDIARSPAGEAALLAEQARVLLAQQKYQMGWERLAQAMEFAPDNRDYKVLFSRSIGGAYFQFYSDGIKSGLALCLAEKDLMHRPLFWPWHSILFHDPVMAPLRRMQAASEDSAFNALLADGAPPCLNDPFLCAGLKKCLVQDADLERLLTRLRCYFLLPDREEERGRFIPFLSALATQCFFNEYIFAFTKEEYGAVSTLAARPHSTADYALLGCYRPLHTVPDALAAARTLSESAIADLVQMQITEPQTERTLKETIPSFGSIRNEISRAVREQYEENPFPRWIGFGEVSSAEREETGGELEILVAGCGTGQQLAGTATSFPQARITAIDLSRSSLAYARRKAAEFGFGNVAFAQGDLLDVAALGGTFDYIICGGVLHHMQSPEQGLAALKDVLKPEGIMRIALYSEIARKDIVAIQNWIRDQGYPPTPEGIRAFRAGFPVKAPRALLDAAWPLPGADTLSECRDTFFHVQEHRFTFLTLRDMLDRLDLEVTEFVHSGPALRQLYLQDYPEDRHCTDLENWHHFEQKHPGTFLGMYKLYIARKGMRSPETLPRWLRG